MNMIFENQEEKPCAEPNKIVGNIFKEMNGLRPVLTGIISDFINI